MKINSIRRKIDKIDRKIVNLVGERFRLVGEIGEIKKKSGLKVFDKKREDSIMETVSEEAKRVGIDENMLKKIYKIIFAESRKSQG
jgi:chorismate mutase/prephenate dehydrogenase